MHLEGDWAQVSAGLDVGCPEGGNEVSWVEGVVGCCSRSRDEWRASWVGPGLGAVGLGAEGGRYGDGWGIGCRELWQSRFGAGLDEGIPQDVPGSL